MTTGSAMGVWIGRSYAWSRGLKNSSLALGRLSRATSPDHSGAVCPAVAWVPWKACASRPWHGGHAFASFRHGCASSRPTDYLRAVDGLSFDQGGRQPAIFGVAALGQRHIENMVGTDLSNRRDKGGRFGAVSAFCVVRGGGLAHVDRSTTRGGNLGVICTARKVTSACPASSIQSRDADSADR